MQKRFTFLPILRACVLKCNFFNIIPRMRELKISSAQFQQRRCGKCEPAVLKETPPPVDVNLI